MITGIFILLYLGGPDGWAPNVMGEYANKAACENAIVVVAPKLRNLVCVPKWVRGSL